VLRAFSILFFSVVFLFFNVVLVRSIFLTHNPFSPGVEGKLTSPPFDDEAICCRRRLNLGRLSFYRSRFWAVLHASVLPLKSFLLFLSEKVSFFFASNGFLLLFSHRFLMKWDICFRGCVRRLLFSRLALVLPLFYVRVAPACGVRHFFFFFPLSPVFLSPSNQMFHLPFSLVFFP